MNPNRKLCIIGSGVSGLSVAYILQIKGWDVTILSKDDPVKAIHNPQYASLFPAASIIPHSIFSKNQNSLFRKSQKYFYQLYENQFPGLQINEHFELFTDSHGTPSYLKNMDGFETFDDFKNLFHPKHPRLNIKTGWKFDCFFADWPLYFPALLNKVLKNGARLEITALTKNDIKTLPFEYIINCSELGSRQLFGDKNKLIYRGHILHVLDAPKLLSPNGKYVSYNFFPGKDIYQTEGGNPEDVYCYPRSDGWILGGSRQLGELDALEKWSGELNIEPTVTIKGFEIPAQIPELHAEIIEQTFGLSISRFKNRTAKLGYRYIRKKENGLRLETEEIDDKLIIHNYGHGGAGVTLSWGCALEAARMLEKKAG